MNKRSSRFIDVAGIKLRLGASTGSPVRVLALAVLVLMACGNPGANPDSMRDAAVDDSGTDSGTSSNVDSGVADSGTETDAGRPPQCVVVADHVTCPSSTLALAAAGGLPRNVNFQLPTGTPPATGWPVVVLFQGSFAPSSLSFGAQRDAMFGLYFQALTVARLLDDGYAVLAPEAHAAGSGFWDTNVLPWAVSWEGAPDDLFMKAIFTAITDGRFGPLDPHRWFAAGISSGGYMSSRMAISYPGRFVALIVHSASYATCGPVCTVPALPAGHPPTLFLHGEQDQLAPPAAMRTYHSALVDAGIETRMVVDPQRGHEWLPLSPDEVLSWVRAH